MNSLDFESFAEVSKLRQIISIQLSSVDAAVITTIWLLIVVDTCV